MAEIDPAIQNDDVTSLETAVNICVNCGNPICGRQQVMGKILGGSEPASCISCLSESLHTEPARLCALVGGYLARRECYRKDWQAAPICDQDGQAPCCPSRLENAAEPPAWYRPEIFLESQDIRLPKADLEIDAEEVGCGDLMVLLMRSIRKVQPGAVLSFTARDPGASADIPSWCRLTGHALIARGGADEAVYYIQRKEL